MSHLTKEKIDRMVYNSDKGSWDVRWDDKISGFGVRISPQGKKSFILRYVNADGVKRLYTIAEYGVFTLQQARDEANRIKSEVRKGSDPLADKKNRLKAPTMNELCNEYLERHAKIHKKSWKKDAEWIEQHILPAFKNRKVKSVTRAEVSELHRKIGQTRPYLANRVIEVLRKMFNLAYVWGYMEETAPNPATRLERFKEEKRDRWVSPDELPALAKAIDEQENLYVKAALWLYLLTGVRKSELLKAQWQDVDFNRKELCIPETKSGRKHYVPLSVEALSILENLPRTEGNPYILAGRFDGKHLVNIEKPWREIRRKAGCEDVRLHDLRRTVGSWLAQSGNSLLIIQKTLNHSTMAATMVYARLGEDPVRKALEDHGKQIMAAAGKSECAKIVTINGNFTED